MVCSLLESAGKKVFGAPFSAVDFLQQYITLNHKSLCLMQFIQLFSYRLQYYVRRKMKKETALFILFSVNVPLSPTELGGVGKLIGSRELSRALSK